MEVTLVDFGIDAIAPAPSSPPDQAKPRYSADLVGTYEGPFNSTVTDLLSQIQSEVECLEEGESLTLTIHRKDMTDSQYEALPEWNGP